MDPRPNAYCSIEHSGQPFPELHQLLLGGPVAVYTAVSLIQKQCCRPCGDTEVVCDPEACRAAFCQAAVRSKSAPSPVASFASSAQRRYRDYYDREILGIGHDRDNPTTTGAIADIVDELFG